MKRLVVLGMLLLPFTASAGCKLRSAESFATFFESFKNDKSFEESRTQYPLTYIKFQEDGVREEPVALESKIERSAATGTPALAAYARQYDLQFKTVSLSGTKAVVSMDNPGSDALIFQYHFVRKGACWNLQRIEDHSIS